MKRKNMALGSVLLLGLVVVGYLTTSCGKGISAGWEKGSTSTELIAVDSTVEQVKQEVKEYPYQLLTPTEFNEKYHGALPLHSGDTGEVPNPEGYLSAVQAASIAGEAIFAAYGEDLSAETLDLTLCGLSVESATGGEPELICYWFANYSTDPAQRHTRELPEGYKAYDLVIDPVTGQLVSGVCSRQSAFLTGDDLARKEIDAPLTAEEAASLKEKALATAERLGLGKPVRYYGDADFSMARCYIDRALLLFEDGSLYQMRFDYQFQTGGALSDFWLTSPDRIGGQEFIDSAFETLP